MNVRSMLSSTQAIAAWVLCRLQLVFGVVLGRVARWHRLAYERRLLASMDDRMLRDIGVNRIDAERESRKPFWREAANPQSRQERTN